MHTTNRGMLGTTVLCVRKGANVVMIGDGQVTQGAEIIKPNVRKVRRLGANVIGGFAGLLATAPLPIQHIWHCVFELKVSLLGL
jgi:ATP-dependent HslUV protease subunit HslV